jgi:hypothetical protein
LFVRFAVVAFVVFCVFVRVWCVLLRVVAFVFVLYCLGAEGEAKEDATRFSA